MPKRVIVKLPPGISVTLMEFAAELRRHAILRYLGTVNELR